MQRGQLVAGRFQVEGQAGSGGMATVHRAIDRLTGKIVALKLLRFEVPEHTERFGREAKLLAEVHHPGVVRYVAHGVDGDGMPWLAMDWLDGETLAARLAREGVTVADTVRLATGVADALSVLHRRSIVHRDLKPSNLMLVERRVDRACLLDFGIARTAFGPGGITSTGATLGTPGYVAPEQARGEKVDARADVFALGCVLFKCLTGQLPFPGDDMLSAMLRVVLEEAPRVRELVDSVPEAVDELVARMLEKDPAKRIAHAMELAAALAELPLTADSGEGPRSGSTASLTGTERRINCLVLARAREGRFDDETTRVDMPRSEMPRPSSEAPPSSADAETGPALLARRHHGTLDVLADGTVLVAFAETKGATATDLAARAARCALGLRDRWGDEARVCIVTGRGVAWAKASLGEAIADGVRLLGHATPDSATRAIRLDSVTASLLERAFHVGADEHGALLLGGVLAQRPARTLLGKPTPFVGRARELAQLGGLLAETLDDSSARPVVVTAPPGLGKTRFCQEAVASIGRRWPDVEVWMAAGDPMSSGSPFGMLAPLVRRAAGIQDGEPLHARRDKLAARVARHVPIKDARRVVEFVAELANVPLAGEDSMQLVAARRDPQLMGDQMLRAWLDWVAAECDAHPLLIVLEDLQWGDVPTVAFVDAALRSSAERRLFVLALARPEVHDAFPGLWSSRRVQEIRLDPLSRSASERLAHAALGESAAPEAVARVAERAGGNVFYLEELVRAVATGSADALPETVLAMVEARIEALDPEARRVLRAASIFGQLFWEGGVVALSGGGDRARAVPSVLRDLADVEILTRHGESRFPDDAEYAFRHGLVRDAAYAMLTESDRNLGHRLAGRWLEKAGESDAMVLAEHCVRGGASERAAVWYRQAAEQALEGNDLHAALARVERALPLASGDARLSGELLHVAAEVQMWRGDHLAAQARALEAMHRLPVGAATWCAAAGIAILASGRMLDAATTTRVTDALMSTVPMRESAVNRFVALAHAAMQRAFLGAHQETDRVLGLMQAQADHAPDDGVIQAWLARATAWRDLVGGDPGRFRAGMRASAAAFERVGDLRNATVQRVNVAYASMVLGALEEAEQGLSHALLAAEEMNLVHTAAVARHNLGLVIARRGRVEEGRAHEEAAIAAFEQHGERRLVSAARRYLATILSLAGDLDAAEREARLALTLAQESSPTRVESLAVLARILLRAGRTLEARAIALEGIRELEALGGGVEEGEAELRLALAEAHDAEGDHTSAKAALARAKERLLSRAERIAEPELRRTFLEAVPENARTLALARDWGLA